MVKEQKTTTALPKKMKEKKIRKIKNQSVNGVKNMFLKY